MSPRVSQQQIVGLRLEKSLVAALDQRAKTRGVSRTDLMRELLAQGVGYETMAQRVAKIHLASVPEE